MSAQVTQAAQDAANALWAEHGPWKLGTINAVTQAFARFEAEVRTAAEAASRAREARLREALERIAGQHGPYSHPFPEGGEGYAAWAVMEARAALTASEGGEA